MKTYKNLLGKTFKGKKAWMKYLVSQAQYDIDCWEYKSAQKCLNEMQQVLSGGKSRFEV